MHRVHAEGDDLRDWGWLLMYTPSASRWFDQYLAAGMESTRIHRVDGSRGRDREVVVETGVRFRFRAPSKALSWMTNFWGLRAGIKSLGAFDVEKLGFVLEIGAGVW